MRRIVTAVLLAFALFLAALGVGTDPVDAHPGVVNPWDWCYWIDAAYGWSGQCVNARMIHYGDVHVYQGHIRNGSTSRNTCIQQTEWYGWGDLVAWVNYGWGDGTPCW
jgi:hypothetical protein